MQPEDHAETVLNGFVKIASIRLGVASDDSHLLISREDSLEQYILQKEQGVIEKLCPRQSCDHILIVLGAKMGILEGGHEYLCLAGVTGQPFPLVSLPEHTLYPLQTATEEDAVQVADHDASVLDQEGQLEQAGYTFIQLGVLNDVADPFAHVGADPVVCVPGVHDPDLEVVLGCDSFEVVDIDVKMSRFRLPAHLGKDPEYLWQRFPSNEWGALLRFTLGLRYFFNRLLGKRDIGNYEAKEQADQKCAENKHTVSSIVVFGGARRWLSFIFFGEGRIFCEFLRFFKC